MAKLSTGLETAIRFFNDVTACLSESRSKFDSVMLYPWQSMGGRSDGIAACFERKFDCLYVSVYEYWSTDNICLRFSKSKPCALDKDHDEPHVQVKYDEIDLANLIVQVVLNEYFDTNVDAEDYLIAKPFGYHTVDGKLHKVATHKAVSILERFMDKCEICGKLTRNGSSHCHEK